MKILLNMNWIIFCKIFHMKNLIYYIKNIFLNNIIIFINIKFLIKRKIDKTFLFKINKNYCIIFHNKILIILNLCIIIFLINFLF
jgi:hypothetical protein